MDAAAERLWPDARRKAAVGYLAPVPRRTGGDDFSLQGEGIHGCLAYLPSWACSCRMQSDTPTDRDRPKQVGCGMESLLIGLTKVWFLKMGQSVGLGKDARQIHAIQVARTRARKHRRGGDSLSGSSRRRRRRRACSA